MPVLEGNLQRQKRAPRRAGRPRSSTWQGKPSRRTASKKVEDIFRQWQTERPDIDPSPVHIYGMICQLYLQTTAFINEVLAPYGLYRGTFDVLTALRRAGAPYLMTPKQLSSALLLSAAGLTSRLNQLEERHLIARLPEPTDRRMVRVQLTAAGENLINEVVPLVFDAQWQRLLPLGPDGHKRLARELALFADAIASVERSASA